VKRPLALVLLSIAGVVAFPALQAAQGRAPQSGGTKPLVVYVVDTEGGKAALYVSPTGQSLLIDSGNPGGRDTDRIMAAVADAGLTRIDSLLSTRGYGAGFEQNSAGGFIANVDDPTTIAGVLTAPPRGGGPGRGAAAGHTPAHWITVSAEQNGTFTVTNSRNGFSKTYRRR